MKSTISTVLLSPVHYENYLKTSLSSVSYSNFKRLFFIHEPIDINKFYWFSNAWLEPRTLHFESIKDAAKKLKDLQDFWYYVPYKEHRRGLLIQDNLLPKKQVRLQFPYTKGSIKRGEWTLLDRNTILYSLKHSHPIPKGQCEFLEDKNDPPSRAYLKLWEVFSLYCQPPNTSEVVIDLGSCPGGWTWVLSKLANHVYSVDTAPISIAANNIEYIEKDAFQLHIKDFENVDYVLSDMACDPLRLYNLVLEWKQKSKAHTYICTLKLNDSSNEEKILQKFLSIPNSKIIRLYQNKHELTWIHSLKD